MKIVGLTGGIGSGKTTVARVFEKIGVPLFIADEVANVLLEKDPDIRDEVKVLLGASSYTGKAGMEKPDRKFIASMVFNNKAILESLNSIIHPAVADKFESWKIENIHCYGIYEAAILFETGGHNKCDYVILVAAPLEQRIDRVQQRDGVSREQVLARMHNQWPQQKKLELSNIVINNNKIKDIPSFVKYVNQFLLKKFD
jgi:dephospho-CoA kinase